MFKLKLGRTLDVPVKFVLHDGADNVPFALTLSLKRLTQEELRDVLARVESGALDDRALLGELLLDWQQTLVLGADDKPAPYSDAALDAMCSVLGLRAHLVRSVFEALDRSCAPAGQAEAKRGN